MMLDFAEQMPATKQFHSIENVHLFLHLSQLLAHLAHDLRLDDVRYVRIHIPQNRSRPDRMLDALHQIDLPIARHEVRHQTAVRRRRSARLTAQPSGASDAMNVIGNVQRHIEVDHMPSPRRVQPATRHIGRRQHVHLTALERLEFAHTQIGRHVAVQIHTADAVLVQKHRHIIAGRRLVAEHNHRPAALQFALHQAQQLHRSTGFVHAHEALLEIRLHPMQLATEDAVHGARIDDRLQQRCHIGGHRGGGQNELRAELAIGEMVAMELWADFRVRNR